MGIGSTARIASAGVTRGSGALRALLIHAPEHPSARALLEHVASALSTRTSHVLWLVILSANHGAEIAIGCWADAVHPPRVAALVAQRARIVASDAESVCALAGAATGADVLVHTRWCELLGRDAVSRRFYRTLEQRVRALAESLPRMRTEDRAELALLYVSRLLFLAFLEAKGWLDGDHVFLARQFDDCIAVGGGFHVRVLLPLFFGTLNTPIRRRAERAKRFGAVPFLNGGLFARTALERRHSRARFSDAALGALFGELLGAYRFSARENAAAWSESSIDPEMLGRAFESLMAAGERRASGAFFTPQALVIHVADRALVTALGSDEPIRHSIERALAGELLATTEATVLRARLRTFTVLDPACGSGAFLVYVLERLTLLHRAAGDTRSTTAIRREVLGRAIHGVDVNPMAVWLCELRLWLAVVIDSDETRMSAVPPLPNLDCNVRVGDALSGEAFTEAPALVGPSLALSRLRERYVRAAGARKAPLRRALARDERRRAEQAIERALTSLAVVRRERLRALRALDLFGQRGRPSAASRAEAKLLRARAAALRADQRRIADGGALPFSFPSHFGAAHARGGFELVIGNPPWVRLHNIPLAARAELRSRYEVFRLAAWDPATDGEGTIRGFAAQVDLAALFVERGLALAAPGGTVALLVPAKLWRSLSGGGLRRLLAGDSSLVRLEDWSEAPCAFDAAVYPAVVIATRGAAVQGGASARTTLGVRRRTLDFEWDATPPGFRLIADDPASPYLLLPPDVRRSFDRLTERGVRLGDGMFGRVRLGVKCGCNDAFTVDASEQEADSVSVTHLGRHGVVEREMLRPLLRGDRVAAWQIQRSRDAIIWTHASAGTPLSTLPLHAGRWLAPWRRRLSARTDLHGSRLWWMLFRTDGADHARTRVVWSDFGRIPRAAILAAGDPTVPLNSCYVLPCDDPMDALALTALLNSPLAAAWLNAVAEPARGGWHRYLAWTISLLPVPSDWPRARALLAPVAERALVGRAPSDAELLDATCAAYRLRPQDVAPLLAWSHHT